MSVKKTLAGIAVAGVAGMFVFVFAGTMIAHADLDCDELSFDEEYCDQDTTCLPPQDFGWGAVENSDEGGTGALCVVCSYNKSSNVNSLSFAFESSSVYCVDDVEAPGYEEYNFVSTRTNWAQSAIAHLYVFLPTCGDVNHEHSFTKTC